MENKLVKGLLWIGLIFLYIFLNIFASYIIKIMHIKNALLSNTAYILAEVIITLILILLYRKDFKDKFKELKSKDGNKMILSSIKIWIIGLLFMIMLNAVLSVFITNISDNEAANRSVIVSHYIYAITSMIVLTPICEEIIFRLSVSKIIDNKFLYVIFSGIIFGFAHVFDTTGLQALYILPYAALGMAFAYIYQKHKNILCTILMHGLHNLVCILLILFL